MFTIRNSLDIQAARTVKELLNGQQNIFAFIQGSNLLLNAADAAGEEGRITVRVGESGEGAAWIEGRDWEDAPTGGVAIGGGDGTPG